MRITFTPGQVAMLIGRAERQLEQIVADSIREPGNGRNITRAGQHTLHETVVTLIRLYREQVPGGAPAATRIARAYAKGADAQTGVPTLACVRTILTVMRDAQELVAAPPPDAQQPAADMTIR
ncbi:hypothetical protein LK542_18635 [Massilia sp. IC2-477]|uniref:hypothetical protein n=1 Tax=unclassified Massilia TaxID=2609279 RepID=UPI001D0F5A46|nr:MULTISPECIES: hypothetical protein [unclassified Massilia]MCC2957639.1 hypothetical protein [Massilia sp. IC2-477]MCC2973658.1 hypothetical protein [Massilia sp. IC2-476]